MTINIHVDKKYKGRFRLCVRDVETGEVTKDTGWFDNLITNSGLDQVGSDNPTGMSYYPEFAQSAFVGTGNTTPAYTDTQMTSYLAHVGGNHVYSATSYVAGPPAYWTVTASWDFAAGSATGNIAEVGVGSVYATSPLNYTLFSHALVLDGSGNPTTITVLSTEVLTLTYELRCYIDVTDHTGTATISGTSYSITWRPWGITSGPSLTVPLSNASYGWSFLEVSNQPLSADTTNPSGGTANNTAPTPATYTNGSYQTSATWSFGINDGNVSGGIQTMWFQCTGLQVQIQFSPNIPKNNNYQMTITPTVSWARY